MHLIFTLSQTRESFSNDTLSQHDSKNEHALLRELVQNCLDAARPGKDVAIRISHRDVKSGDLPGLNDLRNALEAAVEFNKNFPKTPKLTAKIREALDQDKLNLLIIQDKGRGLNIDRMNDILHDGASRKDQDSAGSYGNGHFTTFKFSELLYVIYVGVSEENGVLISGHTILASHQSKEGLRGKDGYLAKRITDDIESGFDFFNEGDFNSDFLTTVINDIKSNSGTGSAVIITAFNAATSNFDTEFSEIIKRADVHQKLTNKGIWHHLSERGVSKLTIISDVNIFSGLTHYLVSKDIVSQKDCEQITAFLGAQTTWRILGAFEPIQISSIISSYRN